MYKMVELVVDGVLVAFIDWCQNLMAGHRVLLSMHHRCGRAVMTANTTARALPLSEPAFIVACVRLI